MPMTQDDILSHYESSWKSTSERADSAQALAYSSPIEDAILYPIYERLIQDLQIRVTGARVLDVGSGSGRWIRFFLERYSPQLLTGIDFAQAAVDLLQKWRPDIKQGEIHFERADIAAPSLTLGKPGPYDLINVANVLFHIPEPDKFRNAVHNLAALLSATGRIVTTEYLPRNSMRTEWMLVRSRYEFRAAVETAGLRIVDIRAASFFSNDPMGIDGPDASARGHFAQVRAAQQAVLTSKLDDASKRFFCDMFTTIERATMAFCSERIAPVDMPSQKLVVLARA